MVFFLFVSCESKIRTFSQNDNDSLSTTDQTQTDDEQVSDDATLPDESQDESIYEDDYMIPDETADEMQDSVLPDESVDELQDESVDELQDETVDEVPDVDSCDNECTLETKQCDPANLDDSQVCIKDSYGCSRWVFSETCTETPYHSSYICDAGECKPDCVDECYEGITSCDGDNLMKCVMKETGCAVDVVDTACADDGQECEQLIGGGQCVDPEVELDLGSVGNNPQTKDADHLMKANRFTMNSTVRLTRFSYAIRPMEDQNFIFFVYEKDGNWKLLFASAPLAVTTATAAQYYDSPSIDIALEKDKEYAIGLFFDKAVKYVYKSGDAGDFGDGDHWGIFSTSVPSDIHTPPDTTDADVYNNYTYAMKLYYR